MKTTKQHKKRTVHFTHPYISNPQHPTTIALIGCGGTGSLLLSRLARLDYALRQLEHPGLHVSVYDGDIVEEHNVGRQNFTPTDIGKNKALCLVEKINMTFGLHWDAYGYFVNSESLPSANIIVSAVDNAALRMILHQATQNHKNRRLDYNSCLYWLDTGNGKDFGQVVLSTVGEIEQPKKSKYKTVAKLPTIVDMYGDLTQYDNKETQGMDSCSFAESIKKQDLFINDSIAVGATTLLWKLFTAFHLDNHGCMINQKTFVQQALKL